MKLVAEKVPLPDGQKLATDIYLPDGPGPFPVILMRTPYSRKWERSQKKGGIYSNEGFAFIIQDVRGTGDSPSAEPFYPWKAEAQDGPDVMRWIEKQPFCNGRIGTFGGSYLATAQWLAAPNAPASLKCMLPCVGPHSFYMGYNTGGVHHLLITLSYALFMSGAVTPESGGWPAMHKRYWTLPLCDADLHEGKHSKFFQDMIRTPAGDEHWKKFDALADPSKIRVPVLQLGGWYDFYPMPSLRAWDILRKKAGTPEARNNSRILIGGWSHDRNYTRCGEMDFGPNNNYGLYAHELLWYKRWLMEVPTALDNEPPLRLFTMGANVWQDFSDWPAPDAEQRALHLHSNGRANTRHGDGVLDWHKPGDEDGDHFNYDPLNPVPTVGGNHSCDYARIPAGPMDQGAVEDRPDVLVYSSEVLNAPVEIAGPVKLRLYAQSDALDTDFSAKLVDVQTNGKPINLSEGIVRASCRESVFAPKLIQPGEIFECSIDLVDMSHVFLPGHRIRLEISSSNFPKYARNLNTGRDSHTTKETKIAAQTIRHDSRYPSALLLSVRTRPCCAG